MSQSGQLGFWDVQTQADVQRQVLLQSELLGVNQRPII